jgi:hypothetical protein
MLGFDDPEFYQELARQANEDRDLLRAEIAHIRSDRTLLALWTYVRDNPREVPREADLSQLRVILAEARARALRGRGK